MAAGMIDLRKLFLDVFAPRAGEVATVLVDMPHGVIADSTAWQARRAMAERWHTALAALGREYAFTVPAPVVFPATGAHNAELPRYGWQLGQPVELEALAARATLLLAMTEYSPSAPLIVLTQRHPQLRVASMPMVSPEMEETALAADYAQVARSCVTLRAQLASKTAARIRFTNGDALTLDLRHRQPLVDDGQLPPEKAPPRLVNLPSGEAFTALYEGEVPGEPSQTAGVLPIEWQGDGARLQIARNRVVAVEGTGAGVEHLRAFLAADEARKNVAELGLGCNPRARVRGNLLEDEKAGPHIALGRSDHIGGTNGLDAFSDPSHGWHFDFVFTPQSPIQMAELTLLDATGAETPLVRDGNYLPVLDIGM
jgi:hypothetical protein